MSKNAQGGWANMYMNERLHEIMKELNETNYATVEYLAQKLHISSSSVRRDLAALEERGLVIRSYGGVELADSVGKNIPFTLRKLAYLSEKKRIAAAAAKSGRKAEDILLLAVSKTKPVELIGEAVQAGCVSLGENKVQEIMDKYDKLPSDIRWHMIGHLQRNKVKYIIDKVVLIHSVDSLRLAEEISKQAQKHNLTMPILVELNIGAEGTKFGTSLEEAIALVKEISLLPNIQIKGLMTVAPFVDDAQENRHYFNAMKHLSVDIMTENIDNVCMDILSMGMTGDYEVAIEEGATMVRVGTGIFGERNYQ